MYKHRSKAEAKAQAELEKEFWVRVRRFRFLFQISPHIAWVGVCNSLPMKTLKNGSDIDLFIVAKKGRLFTARLWVTFLTSLFGVRRHGTKTHKRFCLSFFVEEGHEDLKDIAIDEDIYLARWIETLHPIAGQWHGYELFLRKNDAWTRKLVGELKPQRSEFKYRTDLAKFIQSFLGLFTLPMEGVLKKWQLKRAKSKAQKLDDPGGTIISEHRLKFHDRDRRVEIRDEWRLER